MLKILSTFCFAFVTAILMASCAGDGASTPPVVAGEAGRAVPLAEWCAATGKQMCGQMGGRCGDGSAFAKGFAEGCEESFAPSCVGSRDASAPSGGTAGQLQQCLQKLQQAPCGELISVPAAAPCHVDPPSG